MLGRCMRCYQQSHVTITAERDGYLTHYAACWDHIEQVAARMRGDFGRLARPQADAPRDGVIDASATEPRGELPA